MIFKNLSFMIQRLPEKVYGNRRSFVFFLDTEAFLA